MVTFKRNEQEITEDEFVQKFRLTPKDSKKYYQCAMSFDIESTSYLNSNKEKRATMYIWQMAYSVDDDIYYIYGRTWLEWEYIIRVIRYQLELGKNKLIIYVHNLGYEFQWIYTHIYLTKVFARKPRHPIYVESNGLIFRCSYFLSNYSLRKLAQERGYTSKEELDYQVKRLWCTPLTDEELSYCLVDVKIIVEYIKDEIKKNGSIENIPLTSTGYARRYCLDYISSHENILTYQAKIREILPATPELFNLMNETYTGAFTHSNRNHTGIVEEDVHCYDYTSSYPAVMCRKRFPYRFRKADPTKLPIYVEQGKALLMKITFTKIEATTHHSILSLHKCVTTNAKIDNGRIISADELTTNITDLDLDIIKKFYKINGKSKVHILYVADYKYLPYNLIMSILELYKNKTTLKDVIGKEEAYLRSKELINSVYGMSVTNPLNDEIIFNYGDWETIPTNTAEGLKKYRSGKKIFTAYQWGVWVTAWARWELLMTVYRIGDDVIYCDTDSIKCLNDHSDIFDSDNERILKENDEIIEHYNIDKSFFSPKTIEGKVKTLGLWDREPDYKYFKTLGAKRYCYSYNDDYFEQKSSKLGTDVNFFITVAGLSKTAGKNALVKQALQYNVSPFDLFDYENKSIRENYYMEIPKEESDKSAFTYHSEPFKELAVDYLGNKCTVEEQSFVHAAPIAFTLSVTEQYKILLGVIREYTPSGGQNTSNNKKIRRVSDRIWQKKKPKMK